MLYDKYVLKIDIIWNLNYCFIKQNVNNTNLKKPIIVIINIKCEKVMISNYYYAIFQCLSSLDYFNEFNCIGFFCFILY